MNSLKLAFDKIEADLIGALPRGASEVHSVIFKKLAALIEDEQDLEAVLEGICALTVPQKKTAGGWWEQKSVLPAGLGDTISRAAMLAGPVMMAANFIATRGQKDRALAQARQAAPQLFASNPQRAAAVFEAIYAAAPSLASNPVVVADLMKQMMAMPSIDLGTIARLSEIAKNISANKQVSPGQQMLGAAQQAVGALGNKPAQKAAGILEVVGRTTAFDWTTEALKEAGLTDAFSGSGTNMEQANNATNMQQMEQGNTMLPLDSIVHELLMKEQELAQREQMLQQQEMQLQQALQAVQQMGSAYQNETGVDPNTGDVAPQVAEEPMESEAPQAAEETEMPMEQEAPAVDEETEMPMEQEAPAVDTVPMTEEVPAAEDTEMPMAQEAPQHADGMVEYQQPMDESAEPAAVSDAEGYGDEGETGETGDDAATQEQTSEVMPEVAPETFVDGEDETPEDTHNVELAEQLEAQGPNTAESVEGSPEDAAHDAINLAPEGSPEDEMADKELAAVLNAGGHEIGEHAEVSPVAPPAPAAVPAADGTHEIVLPLRISVKIGERQEVEADIRDLINSLKD